jgi:signal transduction histidine kinase
VEKMHGEIGFTSRPGEGSTFYFLLDACDNHVIDRNAAAKRA